MRRQIRRSVYETNSSSTHAICIAKDGYELKDHIDFHTGEYGWECEEYGDLDNKASYLITAILSMDKEYADEKLTRLKDILDEYEITYTIPCIFRKNRALAPHERSAVPLGTDHCPVC